MPASLLVERSARARRTSAATTEGASTSGTTTRCRAPPSGSSAAATRTARRRARAGSIPGCWASRPSARCWCRRRPRFFGLETSYDLDNRGLYPRDLNDLSFFLRRVEGTPVHTRLLRLGAVAKVMALHERGLEDLRLERTLPSLIGDPIRVFAVPDPQPRAWLVGRTRIADGEAAVQRAARSRLRPARRGASSPPVTPLVDGAPLRGLGPLAGPPRRPAAARDRRARGRPCSCSPTRTIPAGARASTALAAALLRANVAFRARARPAGAPRRRARVPAARGRGRAGRVALGAWPSRRRSTSRLGGVRALASARLAGDATSHPTSASARRRRPGARHRSAAGA